MDCPSGEDEIGCTSEMTAKFKCRNVDEFVSTEVIYAMEGATAAMVATKVPVARSY